MQGTSLFFSIAICLAAWSCKSEKGTSLADVTSLGTVDQRLEEASGLVASDANPGLLWTLNDSGNPPEVFLIDQHAKTRLVCTLFNARNRDWEDIAIGAGPNPKSKYVYVADIGDNWAQHDLKFIYRFEEPVLTFHDKITITQYDTLILRLPDGRRDAETLLIDPYTNDLFLISKREDSVALYTTPYPFAKDTINLRKVMVLPFTRIVAGSISRDGTGILLKTYEKVFLWTRTSNESLAVALARKPNELPYNREQQGEAIAWSYNHDEYYTLSEGTLGNPADLMVYKVSK